LTGVRPVKNDIIFKIAGLPLRVEGRHIGPIPEVLERFSFLPKKRPFRRTYRLDSGVFLSRGHFDDGLLSYAYSRILAENDGLLLHAAAVLRGKKAYLFFGRSGGGKSTVAVLSQGREAIADDIVAVRKKGRVFCAFSTPWRQSGRVRADMHAKGKVSALLFLKKSKRINFKPMKQGTALARIIRGHVHFLKYAGMPLAGDIFFIARDLVKRVPAYEMEFRKDADFWPALEERVRCP